MIKFVRKGKKERKKSTYCIHAKCSEVPWVATTFMGVASDNITIISKYDWAILGKFELNDKPKSNAEREFLLQYSCIISSCRTYAAFDCVMMKGKVWMILDIHIG